MSTFVSKEVREGLEAARLAALRKSSRLRVQTGDDIYPVLRMWDAGFSVAADEVPALRGLVDLLEGTRQIYQCLIVASEAEAGEMRYEFKRRTVAADQPPLDFYRDPQAPVGLLT